MNVLVTILGSLLIAMTAFSAQGDGVSLTPAQQLKIAENLGDTMISNDIRKVVTLIAQDMCGGSGPAYKIEIQVKKYEKVPGPTGPEHKDKWETVKVYTIAPGDLGDGNYGALPVDMDMCLE